MNLKTDLIFRCSKALDFLAQMARRDGTFISGISNNAPSQDKCSMPVRLQTISFLYTAAEIFDKKYLHDIADAGFSKLEAQCFQKGDTCCLIENGESIGFWNAMMAIIYFKKEEEEKEKALPFVRSLLDNIKDDKIVCHYAPGTTDEILKANVHSPYGVFILPMLQTEEQEWHAPAKQVAEYIIKTGKYDYLDLWGLKALSEIPNISPKFKQHASNLLNAVNRTTPDTMSGLYAGAIMQANMALYSEFSGSQKYQERIKGILDRQLSCQDIESGAFTSPPGGKEIRPEYIVHNVIALVEYLLFVEDWDEANLYIIA